MVDLNKIKIGLERETLRITQDGVIDTSSHPTSFGDKLYHKYITTDFSESQLELITPPFSSCEQTLCFLKELYSYLYYKEKDLILHNHSLPPKDPIAFPADFGKKGEEKNNYRKYLLKKYSLEMQLICGIHYNFSLESLDNEQYFHIIRNVIRYGFILPYFFGFSSTKAYPNATSIRCSSLGYFPQEQQDTFIDFSSLENYIHSIQNNDYFYSIMEYYNFIRPKFKDNKITHLELRSLDINPDFHCGIDLPTMEYVQAFLCKMLALPSPNLNKEELKAHLCFHDEICLYGKDQKYEGKIFDTLVELGLNAPKTCESRDSKPLPKNNDLIEEETRLSNYKTLEISTQLLIKEAEKQSIDVNILDKKTNLIELSQGLVSECFSQASITSKESLISYRIQKDKNLTKQFLKKQNLSTPESVRYTNKNIDLQKYINTKVCIKPCFANYGDGITIIETNEVDKLEKSISKAFQYSDEILIEAFFPGDEYRFLVIDYQKVFVCKRIPPFIIGDGKSSIKELIAIKNKNRSIYPIIYEGENNHTLPKGKKFYIRENSNVSTGGTSQDFTDTMPQRFKQIAIKASKAVGSFICGVDIIIKDIHGSDSYENYSIIETNYNPAILIHEYPLFGKQRVCRAILETCGFSCPVD